MIAVAVGIGSNLLGYDPIGSTKNGGGAGIIGSAIDWLTDLFGIDLTFNDLIIYAGLFLVFILLLRRSNNMQDNTPNITIRNEVKK